MANSDTHSSDLLINLSHGDPMMFEPFWEENGDEATVVFDGNEAMSYFSTGSSGCCWFLEQKLHAAIREVHETVGNAETEGREIVVGNGATQLFQAALFALSCDAPQPPTVVAAVPFYSSYKDETEYLRSGLYKWGGDARTFVGDGPYIEVVTTPNNPDGAIREPVVNRPGGLVIHDLAYYWPQYTPITAAADHDLMLFTFSKATGHAGSRLGWALVKDKAVAEKMVKFIVLASIGVSKLSQIRAAKLIHVIINGCKLVSGPAPAPALARHNSFFSYAKAALANRWDMLRRTVELTKVFTLESRLHNPQYCNFSRQLSAPFPAFAWLRADGDLDLEEAFREVNLLTRGGRSFGCDRRYVRVSMLGTGDTFKLFLCELVNIDRKLSSWLLEEQAPALANGVIEKIKTMGS